MSTIRRYADRWVIGIAFANLVAQIGIILTGGVADHTWPPRRCCRCETGGEGPDDLLELVDAVLVRVSDDLSVQLALAYGGDS